MSDTLHPDSLNIEPIRAFSDNYIWLITDNSTNRCFVVDPGDARPVIDTVTTRGLELTGILITHHHADHSGGIATLLEHYQATVYGPENPAIKHVSRRLTENNEVDVLGHSYRVLSVPGHTLDHIAFFDSQQKTLFCGDTLFSAGCGRLFEGTAEQMQHSLSKFRKLPEQTQVFCAHEYTASNLKFAQAVEPDNTDISDYIARVKQLRADDLPTIPTSIGLEKRINPFLRTNNNLVRNIARNRLSNEQLTGELPESEVLRVIRKWKDNFQ